MSPSEPSRLARRSFFSILQLTIAYIPIYAIQVATTTQLPRYFASHLGMSLALVGGAFGTVRLFDIWLDPVLGILMDSTRTRIGRYRPWLLGAAPLLMLALWMLFNAPSGADRVYLIGWLLVMYFGFSITFIGVPAWAATLARSYHERSRVFGILQAMGILGAMLVLAIPVILSKRGFDDATGVHAMGWFIILAIPVTFGLASWRTPDRLEASIHEKPRLRDFGVLFLRGNVQRILIADLGLSMGTSWMSALYLFFFKDSRGFDTAQANLLLILYTLMGLVGGPLTARLARRIGKHQASMANGCLYALVLATLIIIPKGAFVAAAVAMMILGALNAGFRGLLQALTGDLADEIRLETGYNRNALLYSLVTATSKLASALSIFATFNLLAWIGYRAKEGTVNTAAQIHGLELVYIIGPIAFVLLGCVCFFGYRLNATRHAEIVNALEARDREMATILDPTL